MNDDPKILDQTIVPAQPGWFMAFRINGVKDDCSDEHLFLDPILAWDIQRLELPDNGIGWSHRAVPITINSASNNRQNCDEYAIKRPDGKFDAPWYGNHAQVTANMEILEAEAAE